MDFAANGLKYLAIATGVGVMGVGAYNFFKPKKKTELTPDAPSTPAKTTTVKKTTSAAWTEGNFPLRQGMLNTYKVKYLQMALIKAGLLPSGADDGDFGPQTANALRAALINPDSGVTINSYNGLLQKYGLPQYMVTITGQFISSLPTAAPVATAVAPNATGTLASGVDLKLAVGRLRLLDNPLQYVGVTDAIAWINANIANANDYRLIDTAWRGEKGKSVYTSMIDWGWNAGSITLIQDTLKKKGVTTFSGIGALPAVSNLTL